MTTDINTTTNTTITNTKASKATTCRPFTPAPFTPPFWLTNPHLQTILPKFFQPELPAYRRVIHKDSLGESDIAYDFYDASDVPNQAGQDKTATGTDTTPLIVLFHGMEGSSDSHYARALAHYVHAQGWHFVVAHFRSCGGIPASGQVFYNAGDTAEVHHMLQVLSQSHANIYGVGVSLGGNALAKYMGEYGDEALCKAAAVISAPVDMSSAAYAMHSFISHRIYTPYLLSPIIKKALANQLSEDEIAAIKSAKRLSDFDHLFTAPRHGFHSNNDYYHQASALPHLVNVKRPTLLISAKDDPFIGFTATENDVADCVTLLDTKHGGHIGFLRYGSFANPNDANNADGTDSTKDASTTKNKKSFDINWIPETVCTYFKSVGIDA